MKLQDECVDCSARRLRSLLEGRVERDTLLPLEKVVRESARKGLGKRPPIILAKERNLLIRERLGIADVSREKKDAGIRIAKSIASGLKLPRGGFQRFRMLLKAVIEANAMELDLPGHSTGVSGLEARFVRDVEAPLALDESVGIYRRINSAKTVLYLCDNAPELVFDVLLIEFIRSMGKEVTPVVRGRFTQDDATPREARMLGLMGFVTTGSAAPGVVYSDVTRKLRGLLEKSDFIIAKGMGNFEGLTETPELIRNRAAFLFKVKCIPVARDVGVPRGGGVAFIYGGGS